MTTTNKTMQTTTKHPFIVRKQVGRGGARYVVMMRRGKTLSRVSTGNHLTEQSAQEEADGLNISAMVLPYDEDSRPYDVRLAEATAKFRGVK